MLAAALMGVALANLLAFAVYGFDKAQARADARRVSEGTLLFLAVIGGLGTWVGCEFFRHKTRKQPFRTWLIAAIVLHIGLLFGLTLLVPL